VLGTGLPTLAGPSVVVGLGEYITHEGKTRLLYDLFCSVQKCAALRVRFKLEYNLEEDCPLHGVRVVCQDFTTLHKSQVGVEFCLEDFLVAGAVLPLQVVAHSENDLAGLLIKTDDVDYLCLLNSHKPQDELNASVLQIGVSA
jgi:hypothetical protein